MAPQPEAPARRAAETVRVTTAPERRFDGMDVFIECEDAAEALAAKLQAAAEGTPFALKLLSNRGTMVWPTGGARADTVRHWRCRFTGAPEAEGAICDLLGRLPGDLRWMHVEKLESHDGAPAYSKAQGEA